MTNFRLSNSTLSLFLFTSLLNLQILAAGDHKHDHSHSHEDHKHQNHRVDHNAANKAKTCEYSFNNQKGTFTWTGYKFSNKSPVSGSFNKIMFTSKKSNSLKELLGSVALTIKTNSFESKNPARNKNIIRNLFKKVLEGDEIKVTVTSVDFDANTLTTKLTWGKSSKKVSLNFNIRDSHAIAMGKIDLIELGQSSPYESLKKACKAYHRGKDGQVVSYSEVAVEVKLPLSSQTLKKCQL